MYEACCCLPVRPVWWAPRYCAAWWPKEPRCAASCATPGAWGAQRVRVQIALGDLTDPPSFRNAMRGVNTVVHLAASIRDQPRGSIEELNGIATWRMVRAAQRAGVERFVFFSVLGASTHHRARFFRAKALAEQAVSRGRPAEHGVRPFDRLCPRRPLADPAGADGAAPGDARLRTRPRRPTSRSGPRTWPIA